MPSETGRRNHDHLVAGTGNFHPRVWVRQQKVKGWGKGKAAKDRQTAPVLKV